MKKTFGGSLLMVVLTAAVVGALAAPAFAASVTPTLVEGSANKTCAELQGAGQEWSEFKVEPPTANTWNVAGGQITISNLTSTSFNWSSTFGIDAVYVKTGSGGSNLYVYDPPAESTGDSGLTTPGS